MNTIRKLLDRLTYLDAQQKERFIKQKGDPILQLLAGYDTSIEELVNTGKTKIAIDYINGIIETDEDNGDL